MRKEFPCKVCGEVFTTAQTNAKEVTKPTDEYRIYKPIALYYFHYDTAGKVCILPLEDLDEA